MQKSKYGLVRMDKNLEAEKERSKPDSGAPAYLMNEQKLQDELSKDYDLMNPEDAKAEARLAKLRDLETEASKE